MQIARLKLNYFRNYEALDLRPLPGLNVIVGENAQGKTNAVEAVFFVRSAVPTARRGMRNSSTRVCPAGMSGLMCRRARASGASK